MTSAENDCQWVELCTVIDLIPESGVCALHRGEQIALFFLPEEDQKVFALGNYDPLGKAFVLSRGVVGDLNGQLVVASPLYKQHFDLRTGSCLEDAEASVPVYRVRLNGSKVEICG